MPDSNNLSDPTPVTPEDQPALQAAQDELDRKLAAARAFDVIPTAYEARLASVPPASASSPQTNAVTTGALAPPGSESPAPTRAAAGPISLADKNQAAPEPSAASPSASTPPPSDLSPTDTATGTLPLPQQIMVDAGAVSTLTDATAMLPPLPASADAIENTPSAPDTSADALSAFDDATASATIAQAQSFQQSADRLRAALEQNTGLANSLFGQMLDLIDSQNRQLSDVDRKMSDLSGQLKSLKNP